MEAVCNGILEETTCRITDFTGNHPIISIFLFVVIVAIILRVTTNPKKIRRGKTHA